MAVVGRAEIKRRLALGVKEWESLVITPLLNPTDALSVDSVDLRLGNHFLLPQVPPQPYATLDSDHPKIDLACSHSLGKIPRGSCTSNRSRSNVGIYQTTV
jgi:hypothetical protein